MKKALVILLLILFIAPLSNLDAKDKNKDKQDEEETSLMNSSTFSSLKFRNIGPSFMSGRVSDIAIHPKSNNIWYVTMGSGGIWKTENRGTTWSPIFDKEKSYSIGCITMNENNPAEIWVGTGENVGGRHVAFGDGIYKSEDGGKSWTNMGLEESQHISKIIIHPNNDNILWVAVQGPLWSSGGERGLYKTEDGGETWVKTLGDDEWIGVTDLVIDPRNAEVLYAATWQRHRNVAAYMGGGPGTALYKSKDGGATWTKLESGLPKETMGKIGLAISPQNPDVLYAAIELERTKGGFYRSDNQGATWNKMSDTVSGGTGPHYYQELYACPHNFDRVYLADVRMQISDDGGKTFRKMKEKHKHSDNHALAFMDSDPNYLLVGTDGGLYESFDLASNWKFIHNLPTLQYYKLAVDDATPFYNIYGGTQDNNSHGGPSRTANFHGILNRDWHVTLFGDGHQPATEPGNPNVVYCEWQRGNLVRIDNTTGEMVYIQPQAPENADGPERYNWDAPILVSAHNPEHIYFASQRVWKSENRGNQWTALSDDLTKNEDRLKLPIMGETQSWDAPWDMHAMSNYNTITSLAESPVKEGILYAGTDDGIIQVTNNGGDTWRKIRVSELPGVPASAFVNDIKADLYDENTVYVALDNHKYGDFEPYLFKSTNQGQTWQSITNGIPEKHMVWRVVQDHVSPKLMFAATEFGVFFTIDGGEKWVKLSGGLPTISIRDLAIQKRENDLVLASFGRGFFVLDDYSLLREMSEEKLEKDAILLDSRDAWWYNQKRPLGWSEKGSQGADFYTAENAPYGVVFNYYLKEGLTTNKATRQKQEKDLIEKNQSVQFPGWEEIELERQEEEPRVWIVIENEAGDIVRKVKGSAGKGLHRVVWDMHIAASQAIKINETFKKKEPHGLLVAPGKYKAQMLLEHNGTITEIPDLTEFELKPLFTPALKQVSYDEMATFWRELEEFHRTDNGVYFTITNGLKKTKSMQLALSRSSLPMGTLEKDLFDVRTELFNLENELMGHKSKGEIGEPSGPSISDRFWAAYRGVAYSTEGPGEMHLEGMRIVTEQFTEVKERVNIVNVKIEQLEAKIIAAGAPWIEGQD